MALMSFEDDQMEFLGSALGLSRNPWEHDSFWKKRVACAFLHQRLFTEKRPASVLGSWDITQL